MTGWSLQDDPEPSGKNFRSPLHPRRPERVVAKNGAIPPIDPRTKEQGRYAHPEGPKRPRPDREGALGMIRPRMREELYINLNPLQRGGVVPAEGRKTAVAYIDGYSTCDYCPGTLHLMKKPPIQDFLKEVAEFLNMDTATLTQGCREAKLIIMRSLTTPGQTILVDSNKHYTTQLAAELAGLEIVEIPNSGYPRFRIDPDGYLEAIRKVKKETGKPPALALLTHVDWLYGNLVDAARVGGICREHDVPFLLNTAYSSGRMSIDGKRVHADFITCSGHKSWATGGGTMGILAMQSEWEKKVLKPSRHHELKPLELLGCTTRGTSALTLMASFPTVKQRVKIWREEVEKARRFSSQIESLGAVRQLGEKPHCHDLLRFETPVLHRIAQKHKRRGYYLYEELRKRKIVGIKPGRTKSLDLSTYQLTKEQLNYVLDSFKDIVDKLSLRN